MRPVLNLRLDKDLKAMRAIAEAAFAFVREYKGSHSGEHGDGIVRSEFHEQMFGTKLVQAFSAQVKDRFDPSGLLIPARSCGRPSSMIAITCATDWAITASRCRPCWTGRPTRARVADSRARLRCATTTAHAARLPVA